MIPLSLAEVETITGGRCFDVPDRSVSLTGPVVVDSRQVEGGGLFVAVVGEHVDGHDFAAAAVAAGAAGVLATRGVGVPAVVVDDVVVALGALARGVLDRLPDLLTIGITGSSGKTSTKDLLGQVLAQRGETIVPPGSFNNEIGLPLTALRAEPATRHLVLEMGARGFGHIRYLCEIAPPRIGVVLNVGSAHLGEFGDREATAAAKGELVEALPAAGVAVLNGDDPLVRPMTARTRARTVLFGTGAGVEVRGGAVTLDSAGRPSFVLTTPEGSAPVTLRLHGQHQVSNALAVAAVARELGASVHETATALGAATAVSRWRMEVTETDAGVTVVNDAYNANPDSVRAALQALVAMAHGGGRRRPRRSWAVLGEMRELGADSDDEHDAVGRLVVRLGVSRLVVVGPGAARMHAGAKREGSWSEESVLVADTDSAVALLRRELRPGDVVLVKASRAGGLEKVAAALLEPETGPAPEATPPEATR